MNFRDLADRFVQPSLWLRDQVWAQWTLLAIAASLSFLLVVLMTRRRRRVLAGHALAESDTEGLIGTDVELPGDALGPHNIDGTGTGGGTAAAREQRIWKPTAAQAKWSDEPIRLLRREIIKRDQTEARLESELAELRAANEQLRRQLDEGKQVARELRLRVAELTDVEAQAAKQSRARKQAIPKAKKSARKKRPGVARKAERKQCRKCKERKARSEFHKNASSSDGLARWCKACKTKSAKEYRRRMSAKLNSTQRSAICADAPLCVLHHRQADRLKRARRRRPRDAEQSRTKAHRFRSALSSPGLHCPRKS